MRATTQRSTRKASVVLWTIQGVLAALFLFAGGFKLVTPAAVLAAQAPQFSVAFMKFIGACEALGALGLILPGLTRIRTGLTPLAAAGLVVIMIGAVVSTLLIAPPTMAIMPLVVGVLAATVAYARWRVIPLRGRTRDAVSARTMAPTTLRRAA
jgi:hypothetical protein